MLGLSVYQSRGANAATVVVERSLLTVTQKHVVLRILSPSVSSYSDLQQNLIRAAEALRDGPKAVGSDQRNEVNDFTATSLFLGPRHRLTIEMRG